MRTASACPARKAGTPNDRVRARISGVTSGDRELLAFGEFELDEARCELRRGGEPVELHPTPFRLLEHLIHQRDRVVSRDEVLEAVWPEVVVSDSALSGALKTVRQALGDDGKTQRWIKTLRGRGMRFLGEVESRAAAPAAAPARLPEGSVTTILFADCVDS